MRPAGPANSVAFSLPRATVRGLLGAAALIAALLAVVPSIRASQSPCSWSGESDQRDVNVGAPDLDAFYYATSVAPAPGTKIVLAGRFPKARYFSFTLYDARGQPVASAYDAQIDPDRGSASPFRGAASAARGRSLSPPGAVHPAARETGGQHAVREATGGLRRRAAVRDAGLRARRPVASRTLSEPDDRDGRRSRAGGARGVRDDLIDRGRGGWSACKRGG